MMFSRAGREQVKYGKHKVVASLVTFAVLWIWLHWGGADLRESLEGIALRSPGHCFREKRSGDMVQARILVEQVLPDSVGARVSPGGVGDAANAGTTPDDDAATDLLPTPLLRWKVRSLAGHPFVLLAAPAAVSDVQPLVASPDTLRVRGFYDWNVRGGVVRVGDDGWIRR